MPKMDLITNLMLNSANFEGGIDKAKQKSTELRQAIVSDSKDMSSGIGQLGQTFTNLGGVAGNVTGQISGMINGIMTAATPLLALTTVVGVLAKAWKGAQENIDLYLASVDKSKQGAGIFTQQASEVVNKNISREAGGVTAERMIELKTGTELFVLDTKRLVNFL